MVCPNKLLKDGLSLSAQRADCPAKEDKALALEEKRHPFDFDSSHVYRNRTVDGVRSTRVTQLRAPCGSA